MVIDDELRHRGVLERVVPHLGLRVDQTDQVVLLRLDPRDRLDRQVEDLEHRLVLGPPDDPAVRRGRTYTRALVEQVGEAAGARHRVGVRVVMGQDQRPVMAASDHQQLAEPVAERELG